MGRKKIKIARITNERQKMVSMLGNLELEQLIKLSVSPDIPIMTEF